MITYGGGTNTIIWRPFTVNQGEANFALKMCIPFEFEVTNQATGTGYRRALNVSFSMGEALLNRAEAEINARSE